MLEAKRVVEGLERPLPKPRRDRLGYASARILEALGEALLALWFLGEGYTRNAAGKAFQAWRALTGAILALELDKVKEKLRSEEEKRWLEEKGVPRIPTTKLIRLAELLEDMYPGLTAYTSMALELHDYQYNGPDPDATLSKYTSRGEAAAATRILLKELVRLVEHLKQQLAEAGIWTDGHDKALEAVKRELKRLEAG